MGRARTVLWVGLGVLAFGGILAVRRLRVAPPPASDAALMRVVVAHERSKGNGIVEADVTVAKPTVVDLPKGAFAVFAAIEGPPSDRIVLDGGDRAGEATLARIAPGSLPNAGLGPRWEGRLTVRLTGASAAHLAFFSAPPVP